MKRPSKPDPNMEQWIDARQKHRLTNEQVQMARELGLNPRRLDQVSGDKPLAEYLAALYQERFGRDCPEEVVSIEQMARNLELEKVRRQEQRRRARAANADNPPQ
ncbi:MAG: hypothetical protein AMXMBFR33_16310 [Candidatus Xenobia bacterium]